MTGFTGRKALKQKTGEGYGVGAGGPYGTNNRPGDESAPNARAWLKTECQRAVKVFYDGVVVGDFIADMLIGDSVIVEIKVVSALAQMHEVQLVNYLTATGLEIGLLLNFGAASLQVKRKQ